MKQIVKSAVFTAVFMMLSQNAWALSCMSGPYDVEDWNSSTFMAETLDMGVVDAKDKQTEYTLINITECLKPPCTLGQAKVIRNANWIMTPVPGTTKGSVNLWTVQPVENETQVYKIPLCAPAVNTK